MKLLEELNRRNVTRVALAYLASAWVLAQILEFAIEVLGAPAWVLRIILVCLALGLIPVMIFSWAFEVTPDGIRRETEQTDQASKPSNPGRRLSLITIVLLLIAIGFGAADRWLAPSQEANNPTLSPTANNPPGTRAPGTTIAVLPFVNMSSDEEQSYFSDGVTEEILNVLAKVEALKVTGRTSSFAFKNKSIDLRKIGQILGVDYLLEGSVRSQGSRVRITAQLISVADGFHLWSETYDRELDNVFAIQDDIALKILAQLKAKLLIADGAAPVSSRTDPQAYRLYLLAKHKIFERTSSSLLSASEDLDHALEIDPNYAPAYAQRATAILMLSDANYGETSAAVATMRAKRYIDQALALDNNLAEGWAALGLYHADRLEHDPAIEALQKAKALNPNLLDASIWLSRELGRIGEARAAQNLREEVVARDPLFPPGFSNAVLGFSIFGEPDKAFSLINRVRTLQPDHTRVDFEEARTRLLKGDNATALTLVEKAVARAPMDRLPRTILSIALELTHQWQRLVSEGIPARQVRGLFRLGKLDQAQSLASDLAKKGSVSALFWLNNRTNNAAATTRYITDHWISLDKFMEKYPANQFGDLLMVEAAYAYQQAGDSTKFQRLLNRLNDSITKLDSQGVDNVEVDRTKAAYYALSGNATAAFDALNATINRAGNPLPLVTSWPMFKVIADDPAFAVAEAKLHANINTHRRELDLPPLPAL